MSVKLSMTILVMAAMLLLIWLTRVLVEPGRILSRFRPSMPRKFRLLTDFEIRGATSETAFSGLPPPKPVRIAASRLPVPELTALSALLLSETADDWASLLKFSFNVSISETSGLAAGVETVDAETDWLEAPLDRLRKPEIPCPVIIGLLLKR